MEIKKTYAKKLSNLDGFFFENLKEAGLKNFPIGDKTLALYTQDNEVITSILLYRKIEENLSEVDFIASHKNYKRQGLSTLLLNELKKNYQSIWLELKSNNLPAKNFYLKNGFEITGSRKNYYDNKFDALNLTYSSC